MYGKWEVNGGYAINNILGSRNRVVWLTSRGTV